MLNEECAFLVFSRGSGTLLLSLSDELRVATILCARLRERMDCAGSEILFPAELEFV